MSHVAEFDVVVAELPADWSFFEAYVAVDDPARLNEARVAVARANGRPLYGPGDHDFAITIANTQGHGARVGVVRSALQLLDDLGITGRTWAGQATILTRPAPAHRHGP
jgi:hypothetical protein